MKKDLNRPCLSITAIQADTHNTEQTMKTVILFALAFLAILLTPKAFGAEATPVTPAKCEEAAYNLKFSSMQSAVATVPNFCTIGEIKKKFAGIGCDEEKTNKAFQQLCPAKPMDTLTPPAKDESAKKSANLPKVCRQAGSILGLQLLIDQLEAVRKNARTNTDRAKDMVGTAQEDLDNLDALRSSFKMVEKTMEKWIADDRNASAQTLLDYQQCLQELGVTAENAASIEKAAKELEAARAAQTVLNGSDAAAIKAAADRVKEKEAVLAATLLDNSQPMDCHGKDVEMKLWLESELSKMDAKDSAPARKVLADIKNTDPCQVIMTKVMVAAQALSDKWYNRLMLRQLFPVPGPKDKVATLNEVPGSNGSSYTVGPADTKNGISVIWVGPLGRATNTGITLGVGVGSFFQTGRNSLGVTGASVQAALIEAGWKFDITERFWVEPIVVGGIGLGTGYDPKNQGPILPEKMFFGMLGGGAKVGTNVGIFSPYAVSQFYGVPGFGYSVGVGTLIRLSDAGALDVSLRWTGLDTQKVISYGSSRIRLDGGLGLTVGWKF